MKKPKWTSLENDKLQNALLQQLEFAPDELRMLVNSSSDLTANTFVKAERGPLGLCWECWVSDQDQRDGAEAASMDSKELKLNHAIRTKFERTAHLQTAGVDFSFAELKRLAQESAFNSLTEASYMNVGPLTLGLFWKKLEKSDGGSPMEADGGSPTSFDNQEAKTKLAEALQHKLKNHLVLPCGVLQFSHEEWLMFGVDDLHKRSVVKSSEGLLFAPVVSASHGRGVK